MKWFSKFFSEKGDNSSGELNAFLGTGTDFVGQLRFEGTVRIDGRFQGVVTSPGTLVLGREALVKGEIAVGALISNGSLIGTVTTTRHCSLQKHALFDGHLITPTLAMEDGAVVNGTIEMHGKHPRKIDHADDAHIPTLPTTTSEPENPDVESNE